MLRLVKTMMSQGATQESPMFLEEPISQMIEEDVVREESRLSSPWLQNQMVNAMKDKQVYRLNRERVVVVGSSEGFMVVSDGRHSAKCYCRDNQSVGVGDVVILEEARASKVDEDFAYVAKSVVSKQCRDVQTEELPPDINADHSLTALERTTGTDLTRLYSPEKDVAPDFNTTTLLQRRRSIVNSVSRDDAELSLGIDDDDDDAPPLESVEMRAAADVLRQPRRDTVQSDKALLVRQWSNDIATAQLDHQAGGFVLSGGTIVEELPCTGWCGASLKNRALYATPVSTSC